MSLAKRCKVNLPKDWIVVNSTSFPDRVYYFNVRTRQSSWTEPTHEEAEPTPVNSSRKRKLESVDDDEDEIPSEKLRSPDSMAMEKPSERRLLRAERCLAAPKVKETPQMKEMRRKILDKKSKSTQNQKLKSNGSISDNRNEKVALATGKTSKSGKSISQKHSSKLEISEAVKLVSKVLDVKKNRSYSGESSDSRSQSSSSTSCRTSTTTISSNVTRSSKTGRAGQRRQRSDSSKSSSSSLISSLKKNLANKRLDGLKKKLKTERGKIEPAISAKVARRMLSQSNVSEKCDSSLNSSDTIKLKGLRRPTTPTEELPNIYRNTEARFKTLRAKLVTNSTFASDTISEEEKQFDEVATKLPKIPKINKKPAKKSGKADGTSAQLGVGDLGAPHTSTDHCRDAFWEEMEWEPIEEEKVMVEIQEVRLQLSTDQGGTAQQKCANYTINGLELNTVSQNTDKRILFVVVDTNVFLSNLKIVTELLEEPGSAKNHYRPVVIVPWMVLQELDYIKDNKSKTKSAQLQRSAKTAVDLLFQYFSSKHPRLKGQTAEDAASIRMKFQVESPDDEILHSCLQIRELGCTVVLLSNDKNLCNKAMIHNISAYGRHKSIQELLLVNQNEVVSTPSKVPMKTAENHAAIVNSKEAEMSDDIFCEAKAIIKHFLSTIVSKEMENLYGENWRKYTIVQPPWSVTDVLKCTSKHWIAAIGDVFVKQAEPLVAKLSKMFLNAPRYGQSLRNVSEVLDTCHDLAQMLKSNKYQDLLEETCCNINDLIITCKEKAKELERSRSEAVIEHENNNLNDEERANNAFKYFEQIWTFTNNFCGLAADLAGIPHSITYKMFQPAIPAETISRMQPELVSSLNQLIHALRTVLSEDIHLSAEHPALIALYQILTNYFPNSEELNDRSSLDFVDLLCCIKVKKEFLQTGLVQLQELCYQFCRIADYRSTTAIVLN